MKMCITEELSVSVLDTQIGHMDRHMDGHTDGHMDRHMDGHRTPQSSMELFQAFCFCDCWTNTLN